MILLLFLRGRGGFLSDYVHILTLNMRYFQFILPLFISKAQTGKLERLLSRDFMKKNRRGGGAELFFSRPSVAFQPPDPSAEHADMFPKAVPGLIPCFLFSGSFFLGFRKNRPRCSRPMLGKKHQGG